MILRFAYFAIAAVLIAGGMSLARVDAAFAGIGLAGEVRLSGTLAIVAAALFIALAARSHQRTGGAVRWWCVGVILLHAYVAASWLWSDRSAFASAQLYEIMLLLAVFSVCIYLFARDPAGAVRALFLSFYAISALFLVSSVALAGGLSGELTMLGAGGIGSARVLGMGIVAAIFLSLESNRRAWLLPTPLWAAAMLLTGSRAAVLALLAAATYLFWQRKRIAPSVPTRTSRRYAWLRSVAVLLVLVATAASSPGRELLGDFAQSILAGGGADSAESGVYLADRDVIFKHAWSKFLAQPVLGHGIGTYTGPFGELYPHNMLLGFAVDAGFVALVGCILLVTYALLSTLGTAQRAAHGAIAGVGFFLAAALFAGTYYDNRFVWLYLFLTLSIAHRSQLPCLIRERAGAYGTCEFHRLRLSSPPPVRD